MNIFQKYSSKKIYTIIYVICQVAAIYFLFINPNSPWKYVMNLDILETELMLIEKRSLNNEKILNENTNLSAEELSRVSHNYKEQIILKNKLTEELKNKKEEMLFRKIFVILFLVIYLFSGYKSGVFSLKISN